MRKTGNQFANLYAFADRLGNLDKRLSNPQPFFAAKADAYLDIARATARATLNAIRPPGEDPAAWEQRSAALVASITAMLLTPAGLEIRIGSRQRTMSQVTASDGRVYDLEEIRRWVVAGIKGDDPDAKRLDEEDEEIIRRYGEATGTRIIAARVQRAYYSGNAEGSYERLRAALREYLGKSNADQSDEILDAVVTTWKQTLVAVVTKDLSAWMMEQVRKRA